MLKIAGTILCFLAFWPSMASASDSSKVIVFPLDGLSNTGSLAWLGDGIAVSLSDQLGGPALKVMDRGERTELVESIDLPPGAPLSRGSMIRVAQQASADLIIMGACAGTEQNLRISVRVLNMKTLKLSGEMSANGPLSALPQIENELAWLILTNMDLEKPASRKNFQKRTRAVPNSAYADYIRSLSAASETDQLHLLLKAVGEYRDFPDAQFRLGRLYFRKGDCGNAIAHLALDRGESSGQLEIEFMQGTCHLKGGQPLQAVQAFSRILQVFRPFEVLNNMGVAYLRMGDNAMAQDALLEAKGLARADSTVSLNLALVRHLQGNDSDACSTLEEAIQAHPNNGMLQFLMGSLLIAQGEGERAEAAMGRAKNLGVNVEKLQMEDPKEWSRVLSTWPPTRGPVS